MKKLISILLFLLVTMAFSADVKPFYFENTAPDSASQQVEFDYMLKYKLFGRDYLEMGTRVIIPDKSGWNGSSVIVSAGDQLQLGGPILSPSPIKMGNECKALTGPIVAEALNTGNDNGNSIFSGIICLADTNVSNEARKGITRGEGTLTNTCDSLPKPPVNLSIPSIPWPDVMTHEDIIINANGSEAASAVYIDVPDGDSKEPYDIYINTIDANKTGSKDGAKIYFRMQDGGRLVRIFVHNLLIGNHTTIQAVYKTEDGDEVQTQSQYRGNVLFYSDNDITFTNTDNVPIQGTFISLKKIELNCNLDFAGQLLANELKIGNDFKGENFKFVPFDTPIVDIDPELNKNGGLRENDSTVVIPIKLSDTATVDVYFSYCFELNETVDTSDFNLEGLKFPVCGKDTGAVVIKTGEKWPADPIQVNVKKDTLVELSDTLVVRIKIESGAVLPNNKTDGVLKIAIVDAEYKNQPPALDKSQTLKPYEEEQLIPPCTGEIGKITVKDERPNELKFELSDPSGLFKIDNTGMITTGHVFDYETEDTVYVVQVKVTDKEGLADSANYEIKIKNKQEPIIAVIDIKPVYEGPVDSIVGGIVGTVTGKDGDSTKVSYKLSDPTGSFVIDPSTGVITIAKELDYEKTNKYPVTVSMTSTDGSKKDTSFVISVLNVNEPVHVKDTTFTIDENKKGVIGKVEAWDEDDDKIYYTLSDTVNYSISDGKLTLKNPLDYETKKADTLTVYVEDGNNMKDSAKVIIKVNNVNEPLHIDSVKTSVDENTPKGTVLDTIHGYDEDGETITYTPIGTDITIKDSIIYLNRDVDYEKDSIITVKVIASTKDDKDTITVTVKVNNVNEPVHVKDTTLTVPENKIGPIGKVEAWDEDNDKISYRVSDSTKYSIDDNGVISVKVPFDFETQKNDSLIVYVKDPSGMTDSAVIHINVKDEPESSNVQIIHVDTRDSVYTETDKPIYTNDKDIEITYKTDDKHKDTTITGLKEGENKIEICDVGVGKDTKGCDTVTVWYSNKTPIITVATIDKNKTNVNNITIIDEPDGNQYVNNKNPEIKVTVKDSTNAKKDTTFNINVDLKTVDVPVKALTNKTIEPIDIALTPDAKHEVIGKDSVKVTYYDLIVKATVSYVTNSEGKRINDEFTVSWVEKVNGQDVTISYTTDSYVEVKSNYSISYSVPQGKDTITVSYQVDSDGKIQKTNGNVGYTISYSYTNAYGNTGTSEIQVVLDDVPPKVEIYKIIAGKDTIYPGEGKNWTEYVNSSAITVFWTVDGIEQDTLTLQGLKAEKINPVVRCYQDKANNQTCDTVMVYAKGAKEIEIKIAHPLTEIDKDRVDSFYNEGGKYNPKNPIQIIAQDASEDKLPEPVGVGIKIGLALPILNQNGGMPTADDIVQTIDGVTGIVIDGNGNVVTDAIAEIRDHNTKIISVDNYIENYCTEEYKTAVRKNGIENVPFYEMKYSMHVWIFNNNANYVNDFNFEYTIDENQKVDASGMLNLMVDWLAAKDGYVKAKNGKAIATGAYIGKISAVSVAKAKCTLNSDTQKGTKIKKDETEMFTFGYKRPISK